MSQDYTLASSLPGVPVVRTDAGWWLTSTAGAIRVTDGELYAELERAAAALAQANRAVADAQRAPW